MSSGVSFEREPLMTNLWIVLQAPNHEEEEEE